MVIHKADLNEWLFVLLSRLLCKLGGDLLASIHSKVVRVLDVVRLVVDSERLSHPLYTYMNRLCDELIMTTKYLNYRNNRAKELIKH